MQILLLVIRINFGFKQDCNLAITIGQKVKVGEKIIATEVGSVKKVSKLNLVCCRLIADFVNFKICPSEFALLIKIFGLF